jgi:hypothetical protein
MKLKENVCIAFLIAVLLLLTLKVKTTHLQAGKLMFCTAFLCFQHVFWGIETIHRKYSFKSKKNFLCFNDLSERFQH